MEGEKQHTPDAPKFDQLEAQGKKLGEVLARLTAGRDQVAGAVRDIEQAVGILATSQDSKFGELRQLIDQAELARQQAEAEARACGEQAAKRANEALARGDEALRRIDALAAASEAGEAGTAELLGHLSASWHMLISSVRGIEQRVADFAARQDSEFGELRQLLDQVELERRQADAETRAGGAQATNRANEALTRADEALRRIEALAAASQARAASTTELLGRLSADWETLISSVRGIEQRVANFAARQDSEFDEIRQTIDQVELKRRHAEAETRAGDEQATSRASEALARSDETLRRIEALAAASQARAASTTELLGRLSADWETLISSVRGIEQRVAGPAAHPPAEKPPEKGDESASVLEAHEATPQEPSARPQEPSTRPQEPSTRPGAVLAESERHQAVAAWLGLMAPGILLTQALLVFTLVAAPWLTRLVYVAPGVALTATALLLVHCATTIWVLRGGSRWSAPAAFVAVLIVEALGAGLLLGLDLQPRSPAISICLAVVAMSWMASGWPGGLGSVLAVCVGVGTAMDGGLAAPLLHSAMLGFRTTLSVGTSLASAPPLATTAVSFPTTLSVETFYGGSPAVVGSSAQLFLPALAIVLLAFLIGGGVNVLRGRKALAAVAAAIVAAHRTAVQL